MRTEESQGDIVALSDIRERKLRALSPYGPVKVGLTTWPRTSAEVRLMELLSSLEREVESLNCKSFTAYVTFQNALEGVRVALYDTAMLEGGTDE